MSKVHAKSVYSGELSFISEGREHLLMNKVYWKMSRQV